ncbi:hypothetical protein B9Z51_05390 [Limnohabitans sp. T6-5]|uniref:DUF4870 family protein n=1 Tax=Limnohabitans sp. T6-5 TaxID=1100724 RepID=UPI000D3A194B|nr:hypothetical protein [Limnohabitans sp. T6-5]PUE11710.1 hypothetical protein B9Z51_05390 [Limnohabitans sp. T6-5]
MQQDPLNDNTRTVSWVSYILHLIVAVSAIIPGAQLGPTLLVVALIIDLVKRGDVTGWEATHFSYRIRTVMWVALLYLLTAPLWFLFIFPGFVAWGLISIWFLYRIVLGMVRLSGHRPMTE